MDFNTNKIATWLDRPKQYEQRQQERFAAERRYLDPLIGSDGKHVGHLPLNFDKRGKWIFRRCSCGFFLAPSIGSKPADLRSCSIACTVFSLRWPLIALDTLNKHH
jgi:hypothetical protein